MFNSLFSTTAREPSEKRQRLAAETPLRSTLFGPEQLKQHALLLATEHEVDLEKRSGRELLLDRLEENQWLIRRAYRVAAQAVEAKRPTAPAVDWLLDNYHIIEEHILLARRHLPRGYSKQLPRLKSGKLKGFPRVYDLALEIVAHTDGRIDTGNLSQYVMAYQRTRPLRLGELWATPIMLRMALIENLRRVTQRIVYRRWERDAAIEWAERFQEAASRDSGSVITVLAELVKDQKKLSYPFIVELMMRLEGRHAIGLVQSWVDQELARGGQNMEHALQAERQDQAADQASIGNTITSLRLLSQTDWPQFVEQQSVVEQTLREDPAGVYPHMDFHTRDRYRHVVERLAKRTKMDEQVVARLTVDMASAQLSQKGQNNPTLHHVGHFLIGKGRDELERRVGYVPPLSRRAGRIFRKAAPPLYLITISLSAMALSLGIVLNFAPGLGVAWGGMILTVLLVLLVATRPILSIINWLVTLTVPPRSLPRMDFQKGIPDEHRTLVAVPTLLSSTKAADHLIRHLEIRYLANRDENLLFALISDFTDAPHEHLPQDQEILDHAIALMTQLNERYAGDGQPIFHLLHRVRRFHEADNVWMGKERKRGKMSELNRLILGEPTQDMTVHVGDQTLLRSVRYIITLDSDTQLPPQAGWRMVGTLAHPLNRPVVNEQTRCVTSGYGLLQPRVANSLVGSSASWYARLYSGQVGLDPYTREVSEVYHDLYGQTPFIGKGIYDVKAFEQAVGQRFPDNAILSHDLIEGLHARCGFINDVELVEDYPARYITDARRRHRWVRGDWQLLPWLMPAVKDCAGIRSKNPLDFIAHWKMLDNMRRSIWLPGFWIILCLCWLVLPGSAAVWTATLVGIYFLPWLLQALVGLVMKPSKVTWRYHLRYVAHNHGRGLAPDVIQLMLLPFEAFLHVDAIARALWRKYFSGRKLLEWQTASDSERSASDRLCAYLRLMWINPVSAVAIAGLVYWLNPTSLYPAGGLLLAWLIGPLVAWRISKPLGQAAQALPERDVAMLRQLARQTWRYFEELVGSEHQYLAPDNIQEGTHPKVADRTSPTNLGLALLSTLAASDFGFISHAHLLDRLQAMLDSMGQLERFRGHFYNWYRTTDRQTLWPRYVSSVDSGNLTGCLITLRQGMLEMIHRPAFTGESLDGLHDTMGVLRHNTQQLLDDARHPDLTPYLQHVLRLCDACDKLPRPRTSSSEMAGALAAWRRHLHEFDLKPTQLDEVDWWLQAARKQVDEFLADLRTTLPWAIDPPDFLRNSSDPRVAQLRQTLDEPLPLSRIPQLHNDWQAMLATIEQTDATSAQTVRQIVAMLETAALHAQERIDRLNTLARQCEEMSAFDLGFLFDRQKKLLSIGYDVANHRRDESAYDLLASEARLCSYIGIAQGQLPHEHWFILGRQQAPSNDGLPTLLSWSGSMFEYLMPNLIMPVYNHTLLAETCRSAVDMQIRYGKQRRIPWGISESCYNLVDGHFNYQYRAFGVPGLGIKRGLAEDTVIAPYASVMALMVNPRAAAANIKQMNAMGFTGRYGLVEAVDYTRTRVPTRQDYVIIPTAMAHHSGMSMLALAYEMLGQPMQRRFMADAHMRSALTLLEERVPAELAESPTEVQSELADSASRKQEKRETPMRTFRTVKSPVPDIHLLGNGRYNVMITTAGSGASTWNGLAINRWQEDAARNDTGIFCYLQDVESGSSWSATHQPVGQKPDRYEAIFSQAMAEFRRVDDQIETYTRVAVSPEDDIELRRIVLSNLSSQPRVIDVTSYLEIVLMAGGAHQSHPVFQNLFVQTQLQAQHGAILATRRARANDETPPWMFHMLVAHDNDGRTIREGVSFETDRAQFIGRGRDVSRPHAMGFTGELSNTHGAVLDPVAAVRRRVVIPPHESIMLDMITGAAATRQDATALIDKYQDHRLCERVFSLAWTHSQVLLQHLHAEESDAQTFGSLASSIVYANSRHRASSSKISRNVKNQSALWSYGISGDLPLLLVQITDRTGMDLVTQCIHAHTYYRHKGLQVDLVIWVDSVTGYRQTLRDEILALIASGPASALLDQRGGVFVRTTEQIPEDDQLLIQSVARVFLTDRGGSFEEQAGRRAAAHAPIPLLKPTRELSESTTAPAPTPTPEDRQLIFNNGLGGFTQDGKEYILTLKPGQRPPAPWSNVIANHQFGTVITESGGAYTWFENAHEYRLTPWYNDPVSDITGEALYLRDEETGEFWSPTPWPVRAATPHVVRHGLGYTIFEHTRSSIQSELNVFVPEDLPVKMMVLKLTNQSSRPRRLSAAAYFELVLGEHRTRSAMHVVTRVDAQTGALLAQNRFNGEFAEHVTFVHCMSENVTYTGDREEFVGRTASLSSPQAMTRKQLSNRVGPGLDPCAAMQTVIEIPPGQSRQVVFMLGGARNDGEARHIIRRMSSAGGTRQALEAVWAGWQRRLSAIYVQTPEPALNVLANHWLLYQCLSCRIWGRSGFYQSGGAFGFRDQLQDAMAMLHTMPELLRQQLLINAGRQFVEGDVQHWWHPPLGRGVRTLFSDDYLWLPLATARYVLATGDTGVMDEMIPYLTGRPVGEHEESYYDRPYTSDEQGTLFDHGRRAIEKSLARIGPHDLPLIGCGDWNDGMNRVGLGGKGESVWLGFFLHQVLTQFALLCDIRKEHELAARYRQKAASMTRSLENQAWDGQWYRRAYFDDGTPLGSKDSPECKIDSLPQSWSILSGAVGQDRSRQAMESVDKRLVRRDAQLIQLFDPPFDDADWDPGYIRGYVPGVRENGGQYTHAAIWVVMAFAQMRDVKRAWELARMINPILHCDTAEKLQLYKVEPYVVAADVYTNPAHLGRGGWTWYTGSAGWMYRLMIESLLGLQRHVDHLTIHPVVPQEWGSFKMYYRYHQAHYHITVNIHGPQTWNVRKLHIDGNPQPGEKIMLVSDDREHQVVVDVG